MPNIGDIMPAMGGGVMRPSMAAAGQAATEGPTSISETFQRQERSPELDAMIQQTLGKIQGRATGMEQAYGGKYGTFEDMIRHARDVFQGMGSRAATATGQGALAAGLSPLEATQLAQEQNASALQNMFQQVAQLRSMQADVPIELQHALAQQIEQAMYLPMVQGVISPYEQAIAGQRGTQTIEDILGRAQLQFQQEAQQQQVQMGMAEMAQRERMAAAERALQERLFGAQQKMGMQQAQAGAAGDIQRMLLQQQLIGQREEAGRQFQAGESALERQFQAGESAEDRALREQIAGMRWDTDEAFDPTAFDEAWRTEIENILSV
jgi:hypothetical protein